MISKPSSNFYWRLVSAIVLGPLVLGAVFVGEPAYASLVAVAMLIGFGEWLRLVDRDMPRFLFILLMIALGLVLAAGAFAPFFAAIGPVGPIMLAGVSLLVLAVLLLARRRHWGLVTLGLPYLGGGGLALMNLRDTQDFGLMLSWYLFAVVWGTDIGGYIVGRLVGGPKLAPRISPGKTWAGFLGGMALAALLGYGAVMWSDGRDALAAAICAVPLAAIAQGGDLFKSYFKRRAGVKDSGKLIPGHGGMLDRIDGLVFAAIAFALLRSGCAACVAWW